MWNFTNRVFTAVYQKMKRPDSAWASYAPKGGASAPFPAVPAHTLTSVQAVISYSYHWNLKVIKEQSRYHSVYGLAWIGLYFVPSGFAFDTTGSAGSSRFSVRKMVGPPP